MATFGQFEQLGPISESVGGGWKLYHYITGTSTLKDLWTDRAKTTTADQPIEADENGIMSFYADGLYRFQIHDANDVLLYTWDNVFYGSIESTNHAEGAALASASTLVLGADGDYFHVTGTNAIASISGTQPFVFLTFDASLTLTHSASLVLKNSADHVTVAGETLLFINDGSNVFREVDNNVPTKGGANIFTGTNTFSGTVTFSSAVTFSSTATIGTPTQPTHLANKTYADKAGAMGYGYSNLGFSATVASNALTIALLNYAATTPSTNDSPQISVPQIASTTNASDNVRVIQGATTLVISAGSTLGFAADQISRIYVVAIDNAGSIEVGAYHPLSGTSHKALNEGFSYDTTAEGGAGAADSAHVIYSTTARSGVSIRVIGYIDIQTGGTAGNWSNSPIRTKLIGASTPKSGHVVQRLFTSSTSAVTGTTALPYDDTIPQNTEGDEMLTLAITPHAAANLLCVAHVGVYTENGTENINVALFQDATANALMTVASQSASANGPVTIPLIYQKQGGTTSSTTFKIRAGTASGNDIAMNATASTGTRIFGGTCFSALTIMEVFT